MSETDALRSRSFGAAAETYERFRPGPPAEVLDWLLPADAHAAVDVGAGTGALTRKLVARVESVTAVEPDARMAAVLREVVPGAAVEIATAEALPFADGSLDAVLASSSWHWVDPEKAVPEVARVLRPGGRLGVVWTGIDRGDPWGAEVNTMLRRGRHASPRQRRLALPPGSPFSEPESDDHAFAITVDVDQLVGLASTFSAFIVRPADERAAEAAALRAELERHPGLAGGSTTLPMLSRCWRADRAPA